MQTHQWDSLTPLQRFRTRFELASTLVHSSTAQRCLHGRFASASGRLLGGALLFRLPGLRVTTALGFFSTAQIFTWAPHAARRSSDLRVARREAETVKRVSGSGATSWDQIRQKTTGYITTALVQSFGPV